MLHEPDHPGLPVGLRVHPKFAMVLDLQVVDKDGEAHPDMVPIYAHTLEGLMALHAALPDPNVIYFQKWEADKWVEFFPAV